MQTRRSRGAKRAHESEENRASKAARQTRELAEEEAETEGCSSVRPLTRSRSQHLTDIHPASTPANLGEIELEDEFDCEEDLCLGAADCDEGETGPLPRLDSEPLLPPRDCMDMDRLHSGRPHFEAPYANHIFAHLRFRESGMRAAADYMDRQPDLDPAMRGVLVDWLVEVGEEYKLRTETMFIAVSVLDRVLDRLPVKKDNLQLVGVASMLIAVKLEETLPPHVDDFVYISDHTYTHTQITDMEKRILIQLEHKILAPTPYVFARRFQDAGRADEEVVQLSNYLCELTMLEYSFLKYDPSMIAASAVALALWTAECAPWSPTLEHYSGFKLGDLSECLEQLLNLFMEAGSGNMQAVRDKYSAPNPYLCVANMPPPEGIPSETTATSPAHPSH